MPPLDPTLMKEAAPHSGSTVCGRRLPPRAGSCVPARGGSSRPTPGRPGRPLTSRQERRLWAGCFEAVAADLRAILRPVAGREGAQQPHGRRPPQTRTLQSSPEGGASQGRLRRAQAQKGQQGARGRGHARPPPLALRVSAANEQQRTAPRSVSLPVGRAGEDGPKCATRLTWIRVTPGQNPPRPPRSGAIALGRSSSYCRRPPAMGFRAPCPGAQVVGSAPSPGPRRACGRLARDFRAPTRPPWPAYMIFSPSSASCSADPTDACRARDGH